MNLNFSEKVKFNTFKVTIQIILAKNMLIVRKYAYCETELAIT